MSGSQLPEHIEMVDDAMVEVLRSKSPAERIAISHSMWRYATSMITNMLHKNHPEWSASQLQAEVARRLSHGAI